MNGRGRRGRIRRAIPWVAAAAAVGLAVLVAWRAFAQRDLVEVAHKLRLGNVEAGVAPDPVGALAVLDERLAEAPEDYEAWIESALAWQDLRYWLMWWSPNMRIIFRSIGNRISTNVKESN